MAYIEGFVAAVPTQAKDRFVDHARVMDSAFLQHGATQVVECWGDDLPRGKVTDFQSAVQARDDETVAFNWIVWPDKPTRDKAWATMMNPATADPAMDPETHPLPFDGKRMIFGGFEPLVTEGDHSAIPYVQGFMTPAPSTGRAAYAAMAMQGWSMVEGLGALGVTEAWADDVPHGQITDFYRGVQALPDETVVFSFVIWPSREACQEAARKMAEMPMPEGIEMPFDMQRMIFGGFQPLLVSGA
jgi:uncharacterized protein YbaA (DUF1428 family)